MGVGSSGMFLVCFFPLVVAVGEVGIFLSFWIFYVGSGGGG